MKMWKKIILAGIAAFIGVAIAAGGYKGIDFWEVAPGIQLSHFSVGVGKNILIIHGGPGAPDAEPWRGLNSLTHDHRFHYYAQRGCGGSSRPINQYSSSNYYKNMQELEKTLGIGAQLADIERIRNILGEDRLTIIGHSFGGFLASLYAAEFPDRVKALVLVSPADVLVMPSPEGGLYEAIQKRLPDDMQPEFSTYLEDYLDFKNIFTKSENDLVELNQGIAKYYIAAARTTVPKQGKPGGWMVHAMFFSMGQEHDYSEALKKVGVPVLVIHGADDLQTETASRRYANAFPNARFEVIKDSGHFSFHEQPEQFGAIVKSFSERAF